MLLTVQNVSNQKCMTQPTLINLHPNEYSQEFHYNSETFNLTIFGLIRRCVGSCDTLNDLSNELCFPNKPEDLNLSVVNMITRINKSKRLANNISCECKSRFDGTKCNSNQWWNNKKCRCQCKKLMYV